MNWRNLFRRPSPPVLTQTVSIPTQGMKISDLIPVSPAPADPYRKELSIPKMPPGVRLGMDSNGMAMDDSTPTQYPLGGYLNTIGGALAFGLYFPGYQYLAELAQRSEYRQPTETMAKEMTRKWITFKSSGNSDKKTKIEEIEQDFRKFRIKSIFRKAAEHDGFYGMGLVYVDIKGQDDHSLPLVIDEKTIEVGSLNGFQNVEPMWASPLAYEARDPTNPTFYKPQHWMLIGTNTHSSRLLNFVSREVPDIIKPAYNFGGISMTQLIQPYVDRWLKTVDAVNRLISNFSIIFLQTDMASVLAGEQGTDLLKRLKLFTLQRDNQGIFVTDKEREMLEQLAVPLSGLSELQAQAQEHMAAPTHLPLVVLTGITPAGLNASSEGEIDVFHNFVHSQQEALFRDHLEKVLRLIQLNRYGSIDPDITFDFVSLKELDGRAAAEVRKTAADSAIAYIDAGVIDPEEERERLAHDPDSGYNNLDTNKTIKPPIDDEEDPNELDDNDDEGED